MSKSFVGSSFVIFNNPHLEVLLTMPPSIMFRWHQKSAGVWHRLRRPMSSVCSIPDVLSAEHIVLSASVLINSSAFNTIILYKQIYY